MGKEYGKKRLFEIMFYFLNIFKLKNLSTRIIYENIKRKSEITNKKYRILVINRGVLSKDIEEIKKIGFFDILYFPLNIARAFAKSFLPRYLQTQFSYNLFGFKENLKNKKKFEDVAFYILKYLNKKLNIDAFISANINYYEDKGWVIACKKLNIPFIVLFKESVKNDAFVKFLKHRYLFTKEKFLGDKIATYNNYIKECISDIMVADPDQIEVTGAPRTDRLYNYIVNDSKKKNEKKIVTLFGFENLNILTNKTLPSHLSKLWLDTLSSFCQVADELHSEFKFIIKMKNKKKKDIVNKKEIKIKERIKKYIKSNNLFEVDVVDDDEYSIEDLLKKSILISGFNSTSLIEAMITDADVIIPCWGEASISNPDELLLNDINSKAYTITQSPQEFKETIKKILLDNKKKDNNNKINLIDRKKVLEKHLYKIDGLCSKRFVDFVVKSIENCKKS